MSYRRNHPLNQFWVISESGKPDDFWLAAKPGDLPLGIIAMGLLHCSDGGFAVELSVQELDHLLVSDRRQRPRRLTVFFKQLPGFFNQSRREHFLNPLIDPQIELQTLRIKPNSQHPESPQRVSSFFPLLAHRPLCSYSHFDGANYL